MFNIGISELIFIFAIALIVFGPKKLPELAKKLGQAVGRFKRAAEDVKNEVAFQVNLDEEQKAVDENYKRLEKENRELESNDESVD